MIKSGFTQTLTNSEIYQAFMNTSARGPDRSTFIKLSDYGLYIGFHRLSIMDTSTNGDQPFVMELPKSNKVVYVMCNGEIYNYKELCSKYNIVCKSGSDCEIILHLYNLIGIDEMIKELNGEFSFCVSEINKSTGEVILNIGRDQAGTRMLYITGSDNEVIISSELKGSPFLKRGYEVQQFRPRHYLEISNKDNKMFDLNSCKFVEWLDFKKIIPTIFDFEEAKLKIKQTFIKIVRSMTMTDREFCCLLSGGVDSSIVASLLSEYCKEHKIILHTFSIGLDSGSTDRPFAEMAAKHIGSKHHHIIVTENDCLEALSKIPSIIESTDITSNRASCLQYLVVNWISKNTNFKVVYCGDGADEVLFSYKYCHYVTCPKVFHDESIRLIEDIHMFDGLRAGMCSTSCGLEIRFAFLNKEFLNLMFSIDPMLRMPKNGLEKFLFRDAFFDGNYLPHEVLFRNKEAFSDGCSEKTKSWFEIVKDHVDNLYTDEQLEMYKSKYTHMPIVSKESLHYRLLFEKTFGTSENTQKVIPYYWLPRFVPKEFGEITEPSARILSVYK